MCCDENTENRKLSLINLALTDENFSDFIRRTREFQSELRLTIFNRLIKEKVQLASKNITAIYKVFF